MHMLKMMWARCTHSGIGDNQIRRYVATHLYDMRSEEPHISAMKKDNDISSAGRDESSQCQPINAPADSREREGGSRWTGHGASMENSADARVCRPRDRLGGPEIVQLAQANAGSHPSEAPRHSNRQALSGAAQTTPRTSTTSRTEEAGANSGGRCIGQGTSMENSADACVCRPKAVLAASR